MLYFFLVEIEEFGYIPYDVIKPVLESCSAIQLLRLEAFNPYLIEDADELWQKHCDKDFKTGTDLEDDYETYRDMHAVIIPKMFQSIFAVKFTLITCVLIFLQGKVLDREERLRNLTDSIAAKKRAREEPGNFPSSTGMTVPQIHSILFFVVRKTMVMSADVRPVVKGNRARFGTASGSSTPLGVKAKLKMSVVPLPPTRSRGGGGGTSSWSSATKPAAKGSIFLFLNNFIAMFLTLCIV